jgi:GT2 family glycosyltransferase
VTDLAIVLVTHESRDQVLAALESLALDPEHARWEIVVVDNASTDGTGAAIASRHPGVRVIHNDIGRGFAAAANQGIQVTSAPFIAVQTASTVARPGTFGMLVQAIRADERIAAVGPLIRNHDGTVQRHGLFRPRPLTAAVVLLGLSDLPLLRGETERYYGRHQPGPPVDVEQLSGACIVLSRDAVTAIGAFDEQFFLYCEDVDWCLRAKESGRRIVFVPDAEVRRAKSATSRRASGAAIRLYYRSLRRFYRKHHRTTPVPIRMLWSAGAWATERRALAVNALSHEKGLRY